MSSFSYGLKTFSKYSFSLGSSIPPEHFFSWYALAMRVLLPSQVLEAMQESIGKIVEVVKQTLEKTPPELAADLVEKGIVLSGGGALIKNLDKLLSKATNMPVYVADDPLECVVKGTGKTLEDLEKLKPILINSRKRR